MVRVLACCGIRGSGPDPAGYSIQNPLTVLSFIPGCQELDLRLVRLVRLYPSGTVRVFGGLQVTGIQAPGTRMRWALRLVSNLGAPAPVLCGGRRDRAP